jgi:hypothetical protein
MSTPMDRYYDDGFSGFSRRIPAGKSLMGSYQASALGAHAWYPKPEPRELQFSEGHNPVARRVVGRKQPHSPPEDSRPAQREEVKHLLASGPAHSRLKSMVAGPLFGPPQDASDESGSDEPPPKKGRGDIGRQVKAFKKIQKMRSRSTRTRVEGREPQASSRCERMRRRALKGKKRLGPLSDATATHFKSTKTRKPKT